jgi:hypothetical protein
MKNTFIKCIISIFFIKQKIIKYKLNNNYTTVPPIYKFHRIILRNKFIQLRLNII